MILQTELDTYKKHLTQLLATEVGKYVLVKGETIIGSYFNQQDALAAGYEKFKSDSFLVKHVVPFETPLNFSNNQFVK